MLAFSNFGHPPGERAQRVQEAVRILDAKRVDFEYDGEMGADVALNRELMAAYPFCRLKDTANVLIMPAFHSAAISTRMLQELGGATVIGPLIVGGTGGGGSGAGIRLCRSGSCGSTCAEAQTGPSPQVVARTMANRPLMMVVPRC